MMGSRQAQRLSSFVPGSPSAGYYNDLRCKASCRTPPQWDNLIASLEEGARPINVVSLVQLGLGAWQLSSADPGWRSVVERISLWLDNRMDERGLLTYDFPMPHTYNLQPPWHSAMAQGQAASLLIRAAHMFDQSRYFDAALRAVDSLIRPDSSLVSLTEQGPVLQEYPTQPPAHALNGWIFALWGLHDVLCTLTGPAAAVSLFPHPVAAAHTLGVKALVLRLPLYEISGGWSRYDLYPHRIVNVASPFYHLLHVAQLRAMFRLTSETVFVTTACRWNAAAENRVAMTAALLRKVGFRVLKPRKGPT